MTTSAPDRSAFAALLLSERASSTYMPSLTAVIRGERTFLSRRSIGASGDPTPFVAFENFVARFLTERLQPGYIVPECEQSKPQACFREVCAKICNLCALSGTIHAGEAN